MSLDITIKNYEEYEKDTTVQNLIAQANSRYILYNALEPVENFPKYTPDLDEKCLHIAFSYLNFGWNFFNSDNKTVSAYCIEKAAGILEHLYAYKQCEKTYKEYYSLVCALSYYVVSQYSKSFIVLKNYACSTELAKIINYFATRNFRSLDDMIINIQFQSIENIENEEKDAFVYTKILADALLHMLGYIYAGERDSINNAKQIIVDLIELSNVNDEPHLWWIFRLIYLMFDEYELASLWSILPPVIIDEEDRTKYICANIYKNQPIVELFKSQRECVQKSLESNGSFVVGMPTSSGKTKVAEISIVKTLSHDPKALCVYIAPFRSLANEIELSLSNNLGHIGYVVSHLYGSVQATQIDKKIAAEANVIIATPEKIKSIIRSNSDLENRIKLVIVDEGHLVGGQARYITSELLIEELKIVLARTDGKLILLSAVLPNLSDFSLWVSGEKDNVAQSMWRPSAQRFGELSFGKHTVNLNWLGEPPSFNKKFIEAELVKEARITKTGKQYDAQYFPNDKKDAVGATAVKMLSMGSVLIYVGKTNMVLSQARVVSNLFEQLHIVHQWHNTNDLKYVELTCEEAYGLNSEIYSFIKQGIICHSGKLPADVRQSIERLMANGTPKVVIATSTLGQGVNIGVSTVIISNVLLNETDIVDVKDFWNIAGRAGCAFTDTEGKILYAIDRTKSDYSVGIQISQKDRYFQPNNIEKATSGLLLLLRELFFISKECGINYEIFLELLAENYSVSDTKNCEDFLKKSSWLLDLLDDTLLSMDIKNNAESHDNCSEWIDEAFRTSLAFIQASDDREFNQNNVMDVLQARNKGVLKIAGNPENWKALACSSIPLKTSLYIDNHINELSDIVQQYLASAQTFEDLMSLVQNLDEFVASLPIVFDALYLDLVNRFPIRDAWYGGKSIEEIQVLTSKAEKVCNQYYGFHLPWIINAISKKMALLGDAEKSKVLENISLFSEIGVPDIVSSQIYLAGVKSRMCSIELSNFVEEESNIGYSIKKQLLQLLQQRENGEIRFSEKAHQWLGLLNISNNENKSNMLSNMEIRIDYTRAGNYKRLYCKCHEEGLYLCSWDYKVKLSIRKKFEKKYRCLMGLLGVYFQRTDNNLWVLVSNNPYISISND